MRKSLLPEAGENIFQRVKKECSAAETEGLKLFKLSIGQPSGPAIYEAREAAARAIMSEAESMHEYQDNGSQGVPDFARRFIQRHVKTDLKTLSSDQVDFLPIPGIKPMLGMAIQAMGAWTRNDECATFVMTMTRPGYPTPADQAKMQKGVEHDHIDMMPEYGFIFDNDDLSICGESLEPGDLVMLNFPHNPTGIVADRKWLEGICKHCQDRGIRIFNDGAYHILSHTDDAVTLADVAHTFPNLSWAEAYSASKAGNFTGWRVGGMIGSPDFIGDIKRIKGNTDSGFTAPLAAGIIDLFERHFGKIEAVRDLYRQRLEVFTSLMKQAGMRIAVEPKAGFFALYHCPSSAFGQKIESAENFCRLMIQKTGIVGIAFEPYVRFAVCAADVVAEQDRIFEAFSRAQIEYEENEVVTT